MKVLTLAAFLLIATAPKAAADPLPGDHIRLISGPGTLEVPNGLKYVVPLGSHILTLESWERLDTEVRRLQSQSTRLTAENKSLRNDADNWRPGWKVIVGGLLVGLGVGIVVGLEVAR